MSEIIDATKDREYKPEIIEKAVAGKDSKIKALQDQLDTKNTELTFARSKIENLEDQLKDLSKKQGTAPDAELTLAQIKIEDLEDQLVKVKKDLANEQSKNRKLSSEKTNLRKEVGEKEKELAIERLKNAPPQSGIAQWGIPTAGGIIYQQKPQPQSAGNIAPKTKATEEGQKAEKVKVHWIQYATYAILLSMCLIFGGLSLFQIEVAGWLRYSMIIFNFLVLIVYFFIVCDFDDGYLGIELSMVSLVSNILVLVCGYLIEYDNTLRSLRVCTVIFFVVANIISLPVMIGVNKCSDNKLLKGLLKALYLIVLIVSLVLTTVYLFRGGIFD